MNRYWEPRIRRNLWIVAIGWIPLGLVFLGPALPSWGQALFLPPGQIGRPAPPTVTITPPSQSQGVPQRGAPFVPPGLVGAPAIPAPASQARRQLIVQDLLRKCQKPDDEFLKPQLEGIVNRLLSTINSIRRPPVDVDKPSLTLTPGHPIERVKFDLRSYWSKLVQTAKDFDRNLLKASFTLGPNGFKYSVEVAVLAIGAVPQFVMTSDRGEDFILVEREPQRDSVDPLVYRFNVSLPNPGSPTAGTARVVGSARTIRFTVTAKYRLMSEEATATCDGELDPFSRDVQPADGQNIALQPVTVTVVVPHPISVSAEVVATANRLACDFVLAPPCIFQVQPETPSPFGLNATATGANAQVSFDGTEVFLLAAASTAPGGTETRADAIALKLNRYVLTSDVFPVGTIVPLTVDSGVSGDLSEQPRPTAGTCSSDTSQAIINVTLVFEGVGRADAPAVNPLVSSRLCLDSSGKILSTGGLLGVLSSNVVEFSIQDSVPVLFSSPVTALQQTQGSAQSIFILPLTVNFLVPIGQPFALAVRVHADAVAATSFGTASARANIDAPRFGALPAGIVLHAEGF